MNLLVTGSNGQLGREIKKISTNFPEFNMFYSDMDTLNICDKNAVLSYFKKNDINCVINCAAYTNVDEAESNFKSANDVNNIGVSNLVDACLKNNSIIIHISTDYVFDGNKKSPYLETDMTNPIGVYGKTKFFGEKCITDSKVRGIVIRTSWLYSLFGNNFVNTILKLSEEKKSIKVVNDQFGSPTNAADLATACMKILKKLKNPGIQNSKIYHFSNLGYCSWYEFAKSIISFSKKNCSVLPVPTSEFKTKAQRPKFSVLDKQKIMYDFSIEIPTWQNSLKIYFSKLS
tara:strand:+ start:395 stop:1258 length:864 start_codon:yes stop_codon:yes gene_type:complete